MEWLTDWLIDYLTDWLTDELANWVIFRHLNFKRCAKTQVFCTFWLGNVLLAAAACNFSTAELQKVLRDRQFFNILTWKCASRHSGVQFFDIRTSKSAPRMRCFVHFHLQMCFSPQRCAIFSTSELQKVLWEWGVLCIFTSKCAFRNSGVQFWFIPWPHDSAPAAFTGLLFDWPNTRISEKNAAFCDFSNIWRGCIFFLLTFALLHLLSADLTTLLLCFSSAFQLSILSEVSI